MDPRFSLSDHDLMMRFTGLGVGHLEYKAHIVHKLTVEDEPNWLELCQTTTSKPDVASAESEDDDSDSDDASGDDLDDENF